MNRSKFKASIIGQDQSEKEAPLRRLKGVQSSAKFGTCECKGVEKNAGGLNREFSVTCTDRSTKEPYTTNCTYGGNPHTSAKYNKNQQKFYDQMLEEIAKDICERKPDDCPTGPYRTKLTKDDVEFTLRSEHPSVQKKKAGPICKKPAYQHDELRIFNPETGIVDYMERELLKPPSPKPKSSSSKSELSALPSDGYYNFW